MRQIVAGQRGKGAGGIQQLNVWFRFPVPAQRQPFYKAMNAGYVPQAPDSAGGNAYASTADAAEKTAFQAGTWIERPGFYIVIDPTMTAQQIEAMLQNIYNAAAPVVAADDAAALANYASSWDGNAWSLQSF